MNSDSGSFIVSLLFFQCGQYTPQDLNQKNICAANRKEDGGHVSSCKGDSGGPMVYDDDLNFVLVGIDSWIKAGKCENVSKTRK